MRWPWYQIIKGQPAVSQEFNHELTRAILKTELLRIKALIVTTAVLGTFLWSLYFIAPEQIEKLWHGNLRTSDLVIILVPFLIFELIVHALVKRHIAQDHDVPVFRRYGSAVIETSMPTAALALHINSMGSVEALGFVVPLTYFIFIILSTLRLDFWLSAFTGLVAAVELFAMAMWYYPDGPPDVTYHLLRSMIIFVGGLLAGAVGLLVRRQFETSIAAVTARDRVTNLFGQHVSPQVVERLLAEGTLAHSDIRRVAVMFVDFRSFTAGARSRSPQEVVDRLDGAFAILVEILDRHGGIVNKFLGDGFLALFGAPFETENATRHAVDAAHEMLAAMTRINEASSWPLRIGIGLHFGEVVAGNIGSPRRKEYTVIGDTVNLAARIEGLNKQFDSQFLVSAVVHETLGNSVEDARPLGEVAIRGYDRPLAIWQLG
ncbi:adenylate/guanylate cyclase domain-containing protein [Bradyrhizobium prioriisuperbiae]|uniref:adenylate/guanylate cyclase domain-containing protein n=1 Tax=Bradyrhizobium prioriisuperbiae TaxID=2854389 RepID=UPI0028EE7EFA|nr:adenylate/guanylate cyclase domain-containing protein [Bradyrhizobium prioritasuperba]